MYATNVLIVHPKNEEQTSALKAFMQALKIEFEVEKPYNPAFIDKIKKSEEQIKKGRVTRVKKEDLKEFLGL